MKKFKNSKIVLFSSIACVMLLMACGLKIKSVTLSANQIDPEGEVTMTTTIVRADGEYDNYKNLYLFYAVRVPEDWSAASELKVTDYYMMDGNQNSKEFTFQDSPAYKALCEFTFPKEGYKWIAFQTTDLVDELNASEDEYDRIVAELTLKAGIAVGNYDLDIASGSFYKDPSVLLNADGSVNLDEAFGLKSDRTKADSKKTSASQTEVYSFSEYLMNATTISPTELAEREEALLSYSVTHDGTTYPISPVDIGNKLSDEDLSGLQLNVRVGGGTAVETVNADEVSVKAQGGKIVVTASDAVATVYNAAGAKVASCAVKGQAVLEAQKGVNVVEVCCGGKKVVKKFMAK